MNLFCGSENVKNEAFRLHQTQIYQQQQKAGQVQPGRSLPVTICNGRCKPQFYTVQFVMFYAPQKATLIRWDIYHTHLEILLKGILGLGLWGHMKRDATKKNSSEIPSFVFSSECWVRLTVLIV